MSQLAKSGDFCPYEECPDYKTLQSQTQQNIIKAGKTKAGVQRHECKTCHHTFTETKGTLFYSKRTPLLQRQDFLLRWYVSNLH